MWNGIIDEATIFSRALSPMEILATYNAGSEGKCGLCAAAPSNFVSWYRAEGNASDQQGNNNGTLQNGAGFAAGK